MELHYIRKYWKETFCLFVVGIRINEPWGNEVKTKHSNDNAVKKIVMESNNPVL